MHDAIEYAQAHEYAFLMLDGIPKFYHRYGYCDVYDLSTLELDPHAILALPKSHYSVRRSKLSDARSLLTLFERFLGLSTGSFERSLEQQIHWMQNLEHEKLLVAIDPDDQVCGYLFLCAVQARGSFFLAGTQIWELVADDWPATVALLQYHVQLQGRMAGITAPESFQYGVPPMSPLTDLDSTFRLVLIRRSFPNPTAYSFSSTIRLRTVR